MSSPTEPTDLKQNPAEKNYSHFEFFGVRVPLPKWAIVGIGCLALAGSAASFLKVNKFLPEGSITQQNSMFPSQGGIVVSPPAVPEKKPEGPDIQQREGKKHYSETSRQVRKFFDDPWQGMLEIRFFDSDRCVLIIRRNPGPNQPTSLTYVPPASADDGPPGSPTQSAQVVGDSVVDDGWLMSQMRPASFGGAGEPLAVATQGRCVDPHPGEFRWWNGPQQGCWVPVWREWPDRCKHYQWFNSCNGYWDSHPNGAPKVTWTSCVH